ncbi:hypothetical protein DPSP01_007209 [Paraphaeosphaeria sporulosa]|uniref:FAD binding domain-containing protein n=1 Tax=Paraphaeosphaeria sporulosa TaxID=1460663 RepID=A0A177CMT1_9PLEO|nr:FAD binding domain-containing protein [Paraphaeosphaeria sporulosa]OAG08845.1 FAD binding domain-containing protein [Paraphaeosphaeria sporulosa]
MLAPLVLSLAAVLVRAQEPVPSVPASISSAVAPAATEVPADSTDAGVPLFEEETTQLTDAVVADIVNTPEIEEYAHLFAFENTTTQLSERAKRQRRLAKCKSAPGDLLYPAKLVWGIFDLLLGGALEPIVPLASYCYKDSEFDNYNADKCAAVTAGWTTGELHYNDPGSMMFPLYTGPTCLLPGDVASHGNCTQGGYSAYSVHVTNVAQIQLAVNFARSSNLRLVVKNTGHDYNGRSTGRGALSLWTHNLKGIQYINNYKSSTYSGPVFKVGAGVQGYELYQAADKYGVSAVAGICPTVGVFGGYSANGGHSPLMQLFGMGSDQVLALEVVTASGLFITATPTVNSDLYWALLGGGGGTFGIVTSAVVKVHEKVPVTVATWSFNSFMTGPEPFWEALKFFWDEIPNYNANKTYSYGTIINAGVGYLYTMAPFFATKKTVAETNAILKPFFDKLTALGIQYEFNATYYDTFYPAYQASWSDDDFHIGSTAGTPGVRLVPTDNWATETLRNQTWSAIRGAIDTAPVITIYNQRPATQDKIINSVNPAFRKEEAMVLMINGVADPSTAAGLKQAADDFANKIMGPLRKVTPNGGEYGNEADPWNTNWKQDFWGDNYAQLATLKKKWDPTGLFYVHHGVGSDEWVVDDGDRGIPTQDGRLCRV